MKRRSDAVAAGQCNDQNCVRCIESFLSCREGYLESTNTADGVIAAGVLLTPQDALFAYVFAASYLLYYLSVYLTTLSKPISHSREQSTFMLYNVLLMLGCTLFPLLWVDRASFGRVGFFLELGVQLDGLLWSYTFNKLVVLWLVGPSLTLLARSLLVRCAKTQAEIHARSS